MALYHRKLFDVKHNDTDEDCVYSSPEVSVASPPPSPSASHNNLSTTLIIIIAILSSFFLIVSYYAIIFKFCTRWRTSRVPPARQEQGEEEEDDNEEEIMGPPVNYVWYINTVGLEQSVINSIALCKYKKGEGLIESTECSVCLCEFRDDEELRLLPNCSHAFHVNCIDTWLRSHVSCPLCRANIVPNPASTSTIGQIPYGSDNSIGGPRENAHAQGTTDLDGHVDEQNLEAEVAVEIEREDGRLDVESLDGVSIPGTSSGIRVLSDLGENHRTGECALEIRGYGLQPVRRSVSMDPSAAALIYLSLACMLPADHEGDKEVNLYESSRLKRLGPLIKHGRNQSFVKLIGNGSKGSSLLSRPVAMKRSFSSGGKFFLSRYGRSKKSVLPL